MIEYENNELFYNQMYLCVGHRCVAGWHWPEAAILYLVITIGVLFLVPGLFSLSGYLIRGKQDGSRFPIAGLGSLLFGLWLMIMPAFFCRYPDVCAGCCFGTGGNQSDCEFICCA